jgi:hypothetical protein
MAGGMDVYDGKARAVRLLGEKFCWGEGLGGCRQETSISSDRRWQWGYIVAVGAVIDEETANAAYLLAEILPTAWQSRNVVCRHAIASIRQWWPLR